MGGGKVPPPSVKPDNFEAGTGAATTEGVVEIEV